jgi:hypothetical protein
MMTFTRAAQSSKSACRYDYCYLVNSMPISFFLILSTTTHSVLDQHED